MRRRSGGSSGRARLASRGSVGISDARALTPTAARGQHEIRPAETRPRGARSVEARGRRSLPWRCSRPAAPRWAHEATPTVPSTAHLTHGTAVGEVSATSAVVWGRCDRATTFAVALDGVAAVRTVAVGAAHDFVGKVVLTDLRAGTAYGYRSWCGAPVAGAATGTFRTAPDPRAAAPVRFALGRRRRRPERLSRRRARLPDLRRHRARGGRLLRRARRHDLRRRRCARVGRYGNRQVPGPPPARTRSRLLGALAVQPRRPGAQRLLAATPYYAVWDDHEVANDSGPATRGARPADRAPRLAPAGAPRSSTTSRSGARSSASTGRRAGDVTSSSSSSTRGSIATPNGAPDTRPQTEDHARRRAAAWLDTALRRIRRDLEGSRLERAALDPDRPGARWLGRLRHRRPASSASSSRSSRACARATSKNLVWITTDIHFATGFRSTPFPGYHLLDLASGPLSAGFFLRPDLDPTLHPERLYLYGPTERLRSYEEARPFFNFGELEVGADGALVVRLVTGDGAVVFERRFAPES